MAKELKGVQLSPGAQADLAEIWAYLDEHIGANKADRWVDALTERFVLLDDNPRVGKLRPDLGRGRRSFVFGDYVVIYAVRDDWADILRVVHGSREIKPKGSHSE
ncbi:MAG: type II toxin-antitoxin system RelE/ParE family toxin [Rhodospirillaceae bacterium]|nr:type II toxin-antitoxin system RelE/ParE family toxin [Rhodospirillaceae bacterium]